MVIVIVVPIRIVLIEVIRYTVPDNSIILHFNRSVKSVVNVFNVNSVHVIRSCRFSVVICVSIAYQTVYFYVTFQLFCGMTAVRQSGDGGIMRVGLFLRKK